MNAWLMLPGLNLSPLVLASAWSVMNWSEPSVCGKMEQLTGTVSGQLMAKTARRDDGADQDLLSGTTVPFISRSDG